MRWKRGTRSRNLEDRRRARPRRSLGGRGRLSLGGALVILVLGLVFKQDVSGLLGLFAGGAPVQQSESVSATPGEERLVDFVSFVLDDAQTTWAALLPRYGASYRNATLVLFRDAIQSACGFAQAYLLAHQVGHHLQTVLGTEAEVRRAQRQRPDLANALSVRLELEADCYAVVWAFSTSQRDLLERGDVEEGLGAAAAVGDDRIQRQSSGRVNPDAFTHGSSADRVAGFAAGWRLATPTPAIRSRADSNRQIKPGVLGSGHAPGAGSCIVHRSPNSITHTSLSCEPMVR
jgi:predicted metalloprotease